MDGAERRIDPNILIPDLFRELFDHSTHLDSRTLVDLHLHLLPQLVFVQQLAEVVVVFGLLRRTLHLVLLLLVLEVLLVVLVLVCFLLVDGGLGVVLLVVVAARRFLAIHDHHLVVGWHCTVGVAVWMCLLLVAEVLAEDVIQCLLIDLRWDVF